MRPTPSACRRLALCLGLALACGCEPDFGSGGRPDAGPRQRPTDCTFTDVAQDVFHMWPGSVTPDPNGWTVSWYELSAPGAPRHTNVLRVPASGEPYALAQAPTGLGDPDAYFEYAVQVEGTLVVQLASEHYAIPLAATANAYPLPALGDRPSFGLVALDGPTFAVAQQVSDHLNLRMANVVTQQVVADVALDIPPPAQPALFDRIPARTAMLKLSDGGLFLAWVVQDGKGIDGLRLDPEWHVVAGPTALVVDAPTALHAPKLAELSNARVGMVWSGNSGLEIRYAEFATSLDAVTPSAGLVVNFETKGSQEYPDITPITGGDRVLISWGLENAPGPVHGRIVGSIEPLDLVPVHADLDLGGDCVTQGLPPVISTSAGGVLVAWFDVWNTQEVLITRPLGAL